MTDDYDALDIRSLVRRIPWPLHECHCGLSRTSRNRFEVRVRRIHADHKAVFGPAVTVASFRKYRGALRRVQALGKVLRAAVVLVGS